MSALEESQKLRAKAAQARRLASKMPQIETAQQLLRIADQFEAEAEQFNGQGSGDTNDRLQFGR